MPTENQTQSTEATENKSAQTTPVQEQSKGQDPQAIEVKKFKFKVNDQEEELPEQELVELIKAGRSAHVSKKQADEMRLKAEQIFQQLKENPRKLLSDPTLGVDLYKLAEETLLEKIQQDMLTPEQKKIRDYEQRFKEIEEKEKADQAKKDQETLTQAETHWAGEYDKLFHEALTSSGLPKTPKTIKRMAELAATHHEQGRDIDAKTLAAVVREDYLTELKDLLGASDEDALLQLLGDEIGNKIRKADLKRLKGRPGLNQVTVGRNSTQITKSNPSPKMTALEWRERMERIKRGEE